MNSEWLLLLLVVVILVSWFLIARNKPEKEGKKMSDKSKLEFEIVMVGTEYQVKIRAPGNRALLAVSDTLYDDKEDAENMIRIIRENAADAVIDDQT